MYALKAITAPSHASSTMIILSFHSAPFVHRVVVGYRRLMASHGTNILHSGQKGWRQLPSSRINILPHTVRCTKWNQRLVISSPPPLLHPSTGNSTDPAISVNYTLNSAGGCGASAQCGSHTQALM